MISIIIPVYNGEKYLAECIESALGYGEVIVVNDGSTDSTEKIIDMYPVQKINKANGGTASALNAGIKKASGEWIKWLSADDVLRPSFGQMMAYVSDTDRIYYTHYTRMGKNNTDFIEPDYNSLPSDERKGILLSRFYGNGSTSLIHKSVFEKCGYFDEKLGYQEDYEFWLRCVLLFDITLHLVPLNTVFYRIHDGQLTEQKKYDAIRKSESIRKIFLKKIDAKYKRIAKKYQPSFVKKCKILAVKILTFR
ncbi:MAG TPA: glycosyltransferase [Nitrosarchaeum sp.]|nr:glycosyltransferase [Nitrosarchaeum sp.]